ncbi:MAG: hypothetical protein D6772_12450 [Bacteroidetes bacterium]|nr:MAG: hypothetical protein D6772_12450 [Bacteroidota bacterium]
MSSQSWLPSLHLATAYLSPAYRFREKLTPAIQLLQPHFESDYAILLEMAPNVVRTEVLHFQRLLKIPAKGLAKEYPIPRPLLRADLSSKDLLNWFEINTKSGSQPAPEGLPHYHLTHKHLAQMRADRIGKLLVSGLELKFQQLYVFPLLLRQQLWGLLCFCTPKAELTIPIEGYYCTHIFARTLADALAQQKYDIRKALKTDFFIGSPTAISSPSKSVKVKDAEDHLLTTIITNTVPGDIFLVDIQAGKAIFSNTQYFLGYNIDKKENPLELFASIIHPDDLNVAVLDFIHKLKNAADGEVISSEYRMQHKQGHWVWISERAKVFKRFPDGVVHQYISIMQDITKEREAELTLIEQKALLQAILHTLPDIKLRLNNMGQIINAFGTDTESNLLNAYVHSADTKTLSDFLPPFVVRGILANVDKAIAQSNLQTFEFFLSKQGEVSYFEARIAPVGEEEAILVLRNMTRLKQVQNDLREQNAKLDQKNRLLERYIDSNLQLENFAYIASHDLREPLRTIRTFAQFLNRNLGSTLDAENRSHLDFVIGAANRMNQLIEDLLTYSMVNSKPLNREPIDLPQVLNDLLQELQSFLEESQAEVELVNIPTRIYGSPARIQQLFQNLISNAVKFRQPNLPPRVLIRGQEDHTHWQFSVSDNGIGIDSEFHDSIFFIFKRLHTTDQYPGTGIGLALVKRIVNQHGGDIWVESEPGRGTTFTFTILK